MFRHVLNILMKFVILNLLIVIQDIQLQLDYVDNHVMQFQSDTKELFFMRYFKIISNLHLDEIYQYI